MNKTIFISLDSREKIYRMDDIIFKALSLGLWIISSVKSFEALDTKSKQLCVHFFHTTLIKVILLSESQRDVKNV